MNPATPVARARGGTRIAWIFNVMGLCFLAACIPQLLASTASGPRAAPGSGGSTEEGGALVEPGMIEFDTESAADGKWHVVFATGYFPGGREVGPASYSFGRSGKAGEEQAIGVSRPYHDGIAWVGNAAVGENGRLRQNGEHREIVDAPGAYVLRLNLEGQPVEEAIQIAETKVTDGERGLIIDPATYADRAALRFDRDVHGIDIGYPHEPRLWITLPTSRARASTRADFFWYLGNTYREHSFQNHELGGIGLGQTFEMPVRFWTWPKALDFEKHVLASNGTWRVHVFHEGTYATTCEFSVAGGVVTNRRKSAARLSCKALAGEAEVRQRAAKEVPPNPIDPQRERELLALHRSSEVREVFKELVMLRKARNSAQLDAGTAAVASENARTEYGAKQAAERSRAHRDEANSTQKQVDKVERRYLGLVNKHGSK